MTLTQGSLRDAEGIRALEEAATELYKALQAGRDRGEFGGPVPYPVVITFQTWLLPWSVWRSTGHTVYTSTRALCSRLRCTPIWSHAQFVVKSKGLPTVIVAFRRFERTVEARRSRQSRNQESQGPREPSRSLQWTHPIYEGDG